MNRLPLIAALALLSVSCVTDDVNDVDRPTGTSSKIINTPDHADRGSLLVKLYSYDSTFTVEYEGAAISATPLVPTGKRSEQELQSEDIYRWWVLHFDEDADIEALAKAMSRDERIAVVEYNALVEPIASEPVVMPRTMTRSEDATLNMPFNDPELPYMWNYDNTYMLENYPEHQVAGADINLFEAWKYCTGDPRIVVAVLDGGVYYEHQDLAANMWVNEAEKNGMLGIDDDENGYVDDIYGYNFYEYNGKIVPDSHGSHVAGTIAAVNNNGYCVSGIAGGSGNNDGCRIMSCQIYQNGKAANASNIISAIYYATNNGAVIMNNSWAYTSGSYKSDADFNRYLSAMTDAFSYFERNAGIEGLIDGGVVIFAAGNDSSSMPSYPGAYYNHICVSAMGPDYLAGYYTNYGDGVNICAPGGEKNIVGNYGWSTAICSTTLSSYGYDYDKGTSMAAPHVSGCAALGLSYALQKGYSFTLDEFKSLILSSVHDIDKYQVGTKVDIVTQTEIDLTERAGKLGSGYIDAHLLLMQIEGTACLYFSAGAEAKLSLDNHFGGGSEKLTYTDVIISAEDMTSLGITTAPYVDSDGYLRIKCANTGTARMTVKAIVGGDAIGGEAMGGMETSREFMLVVKGRIAENDGWL